MKRNTLIFALMIATVAALTGCGKEKAVQVPEVENTTIETTEEAAEEVVEDAADAEAVEEETEEYVGDQEVGDYPSNEFEERVGKTSFASYDEIIGLLEGDEAYALVNIKGHEGEVLLVTSYTYEYEDGLYATTECTPYTQKANGEITADSVFVSGGTASPVAMDAEGLVYTATHISVDKECYGENGTGIPAVMVMCSVSGEEIGEDGEPASVIGFVRTKNSVVDDDSVFLEGNEVELYDQVFDEYLNNTTPIGFTRVQ